MLGFAFFGGSIILVRGFSILKDSPSTTKNLKVRLEKDVKEVNSTLAVEEKLISNTRTATTTTTTTTTATTMSAGTLFLGNQLPNNWQRIWSEQRGNGRCEVKVVNNFTQTIAILCWVGFDGTLYHFRRINDCSINDGSVSNYITEFATIYHTFVCFTSAGSDENIKRLEQLNPEHIIFIFQPNEEKRYLIDLNDTNITLDSMQIQISSPLRDSLFKEYEPCEISGFMVYVEKSILTAQPEVLSTLQIDLEAMSHLLPSLPLQLLRTYTPMYVNSSIVYGTVDSPINGRHMCYHPFNGSAWLEAHGLNPTKSGSVEINCVDDYLQTRDLWGIGGLLLHEFSHAFHDKHTPDGYSCEVIRQAYELAMSSQLYHSVNVHGVQGKNGPIKAYACTNCMEFWAELSVAFHCKDSNLEFNKWYPHNSTQLLAHDPSTFALLNQLWNCEQIPCNSDRLAIERI